MQVRRRVEGELQPWSSGIPSYNLLRHPLDSSALFLHALRVGENGNRWEELGRAVLAARMRSGYADTRKWADTVGRSSRMLLGLERGEHVGPKTLTKVEDTLGWPVGWSHRILTGEVVGAPPEDEPFVRHKGGDAMSTVVMADLLLEIRELRREVNELRRDRGEG